MQPRTLLQWAGATAAPGSFADSVVILIDHQEEYRSGRLRLAGIDDAIGACERLLELARAAGAPIVHVVQQAPPGAALFAPDGAFAGIFPELSPRQDETIVPKTRPSSFFNTTLKQAVESTGRRSLVVAGFMTHMCVSTTVRAALDHGFRCTVVAAATATRDLPDPLGGVVPAADVQRAALASLADRFAVVVPDADALAL
jgi:nicotinamidase-related amidase